MRKLFLKNRYRLSFLCMAAAFILLQLAGCDSQVKGSWPNPYLGDEQYNAPVAAIIFGEVPGINDEGIFYRDVIDLDGLVVSAEKDVLLFLYNGLSTDMSGLLAHAERLTEKHHEKLLVICIDVAREPSAAQMLHVAAFPDYVLLLQDGQAVSFGAYDYDTFLPSDVDAWLQELI